MSAEIASSTLQVIPSWRHNAGPCSGYDMDLRLVAKGVNHGSSKQWTYNNGSPKFNGIQNIAATYFLTVYAVGETCTHTGGMISNFGTQLVQRSFPPIFATFNRLLCPKTTVRYYYCVCILKVYSCSLVAEYPVL